MLINNYPFHRFVIFNFEQYENTPAEPMLDTEGHITNLFHELPRHLNKNDKQLLLESQRICKKHKEILLNVNKTNMLLYPRTF